MFDKYVNTSLKNLYNFCNISKLPLMKKLIQLVEMARNVSHKFLIKFTI